MKVSIPIDELTEEQVNNLLLKILCCLNECDDDIRKEFEDTYLLISVNDYAIKEIPNDVHLMQLIQFLNAADDEDFFGTEGWKHRFGMD
jgi:hypothetical protein